VEAFLWQGLAVEKHGPEMMQHSIRVLLCTNRPAWNSDGRGKGHRKLDHESYIISNINLHH
jgi:hypothetical protein